MKKILFLLMGCLFFTQWGFSQEVKYQLSSHILDINLGKPAPHVRIDLAKLQKDNSWKVIDSKYTDTNGRVKDFLKEGASIDNRGIYKLIYHTKPYFEAQKTSTFYPFIEVVFEIKDQKSHYHVPITLSPYGYSTYRGS